MTETQGQTPYETTKTRQALAEVFRHLIPHLEDFTFYSLEQLTQLAKEKALLTEKQTLFFLVMLGNLLRLGHFGDADELVPTQGRREAAWYGMRWKIAMWDGWIWAKTG